MHARTRRLGFLAVLLLTLTSVSVGAQEKKGGNPEAAQVKNPQAATPESIAAGEAVYMKRCRGCHAKDGSGGPPKDTGEEPAWPLNDDDWVHGNTDGEIFHVIRNGVPPSLVMEPWDDRISETDTWHLVNFIRTLNKNKK